MALCAQPGMIVEEDPILLEDVNLDHNLEEDLTQPEVLDGI